MIKRLAQIGIILLFTTFCGFGQDLNYGPGYRRGITTNPAYSGVKGVSNLNLSYYNFYPGKGYNLSSIYFAFDSYIPVLHGGTGVFISNDISGDLLNDLRTGLTYSYHLKASGDLYINAGLTASVITRGLNTRKILLPDMIDPFGTAVLHSGEVISDRSRSVFDVGTGFLFAYKNFTGGVSLNHFAEPDIYGTGINAHRLRRKYMFQVSGEFISKRNGDLVVLPALSFDLQGENYNCSAGASVKYKSISINSLLLYGNAGKIDFQAGFTINTGKLQFYYSHMINIASQDVRFPLSLMHMAGVNISLNSVDKRKIIKTINFPEL